MASGLSTDAACEFAGTDAPLARSHHAAGAHFEMGHRPRAKAARRAKTRVMRPAGGLFAPRAHPGPGESGILPSARRPASHGAVGGLGRRETLVLKGVKGERRVSPSVAGSCGPRHQPASVRGCLPRSAALPARRRLVGSRCFLSRLLYAAIVFVGQPLRYCHHAALQSRRVWKLK